MATIREPAIIVFATVLGLFWFALALAWFVRWTGLGGIVLRFWRESGAFVRIASVAALVAVSVYGGSKSAGTNQTRPGGHVAAAIPRPASPASTAGGAHWHGGGSSTNGLRFSSFSFDGVDRFDFSVAWSATNLAEYAAIDVFHKQALDDPAWRWIRRREVWLENGEDEFSLSGRGIELGCVFTDFAASEAGKHLSDPAAGVSNAPVCVVGPAGLGIPFDWLDSFADNPGGGVILVEGRGTSQPDGSLVLSIGYDGSRMSENALPVLVAPVEDFYRWHNLRSDIGGPVARPADTREPSALPDNATDSRHVVFIHGFSVSEAGARGWNSEMFKRLWQSGCNSIFHAVTWYGNDGVFWDAFDGGDNYHGNVVHAFETASVFASQFATLSGDTTVLAHSLGNMVVCSAIQDHGFRPARYFMLNAAVPAESFDATQWNTDETNNPFEFEDWVGHPAKSWASCWHELFPTNDIRHKLTWKGRFANVPQLTTLYNYYSSGDEVLSIFDTPDLDGSGKITIHPFGLGGKRYSSWQKQERFKGRWLQSALGGFAGTSEMGWGFSTQGYYGNGQPPLYQSVYNPIDHDDPVTVRSSPYGTNDAHAASSEQLRIDPVFNHEPPGILSGNLSPSDIDALLARGVPALSGPVGAKLIGERFEGLENDLNSSAGAANWPRKTESSWTGWRHSDIKAVAFPFVFQTFRDFVQ